jgi:hypothetical protein
MQFFKNPSILLAKVSAAVVGGCLLLGATAAAVAQDPGQIPPTAPPVADTPPGAIYQPAFVEEDEAFSLNSLMGDDRPFDIGGWTQFGYHNRSTGVFNTHPHRVNLHQQWLYIQRVADGSNGWDFGFRFDALYGVDAQNTQAFGNPPGTYDFMNGFDHGIYGWAFPQAYAEAAMGDLSIKAGHFFTPLGYEVVAAPDNFFYSHAFTHNFNEPFTHTGVLGTYQVNDLVTAYGGWTAGWDTGFERFNDGDNSDGSNFIGGFSMGLTDNLTAVYLTTIGDLGFIGEGYTHSIVIDAALSDDLQYVLSTDLVEVNGAPGTGTNHRFGWANYLFYTVNDMLKAGVRAEWFKSGGNNLYEITTGVNILPMSNFIIRPEVRWQFGDSDGDERFFNNTFGIPTGGTFFGIDAILTY